MNIPVKIADPTNFTVPTGLDTGPVSTEPYISVEFFEREREQVFRRVWLSMGRVEQVPEPGSYVVKEVEICGASVLITQGKGGEIRAFHNVCSHRGNLVALDDAGKSSRFVCRYHGWTYKQDGELIGVPDAPNFFDLDKKKCGLTPIATDVWEGWIFINLAPEPEVSLAEFLGDLGQEYRGIEYANAHNSIKFEANLKANWKVIADAFAESYHVPTIHPDTIGTTFSSRENPFSHPLSIKTWGPHRSFSNFGNPDYSPPEHALVERLCYRSVKSGNTVSASDSSHVESLLRHPAINPSKTKSWGADSTWLFPNFQIDVSPGGFWSHHFWPLTVNTTRWVSEYFMPVATNVDMRMLQEHYTARLADILIEDVANTERTQKGMESRGKSELILQDAEVLIRHSLHHIRKWVDAPTVRVALS